MIFFPYTVDFYFSRRPWGNLLMIAVCSLVSIAITVLLVTDTISGELVSWAVAGGWNPIGLVGHLFLHQGLLHLAGNMYFMWIFGSTVCEAVGDRRFPVIFVLLGVVAGIIHVIADGRPAVGASGAVSGLIGMHLALYPTNKVSVFYLIFPIFRTGVFQIAGFWLVLFWFTLDLWGAYAGSDNIAHWAHIGGLVFGMALAILMLRKRWIVMHELDFPTLPDYLGWRRDETPAAERPAPNPPVARNRTKVQPAIEVDCPHCEQPIEVPPELIGEIFDCPHCSGAIELE